MGRNLILLLAIMVTSAVFQGCASTPMSIPSSYMNKDREISVQISEIEEKPEFRDSKGGGIIGWAVSLGRSSDMKEMFEGVKGETVKELLRQKIEQKFDGPFVVDEESKDLRLEVEVIQWGWFLPTTAFGIKAGSYQLEIIGNVRVYDLSTDNENVAGVMVTSQKPLGNNPTAEACQTALQQAIDDFSEKAAKTLLKEMKI